MLRPFLHERRQQGRARWQRFFGTCILPRACPSTRDPTGDARVNFIAEILSYVLSTIVALIPIVNPFAAAPMVVSMTASLTDAERRDQVRRACVYMFSI